MRMTGIVSAGQGWGAYYPYTVSETCLISRGKNQ
jgi:hypothetical protein